MWRRAWEVSKAPSVQDVETILREVPRFELAALPAETSAGKMEVVGDGVVRSAIRSSLVKSTGPMLKKELHLYGYALRQWTIRRSEKWKWW